MNYPYPLGAANPTRWQYAVALVTDLVKSLDEEANFALQYFPTDIGCEALGPSVPFGQGATSNIEVSLSESVAGGYTPTYGALRSAFEFLVDIDDANPEYIIMATDGIPNCGCVNGFGEYCSQEPLCESPCRLAETSPDPGAALEMVGTLREAGIRTFVIGMAFQQSEAMLEQMAMAGGMPRPSVSPAYYPANDGSELEDALRAVSSRIVSCNLKLTHRPHHADYTSVFVNDQPVSRDPSHQDGWDFVFDAGVEIGISLFGPACEALQDSADHEVRAVYDCPPVD
jgi:hypothetical protein